MRNILIRFAITITGLSLLNCGGKMGGGEIDLDEMQSPIVATLTIAGLGDSTLTLQHNQAETITLSNNGSFTWNVPAAATGSYSITVYSPPMNQVCLVTGGNGDAGSGDAVSVSVDCADISLSAFYSNAPDWSDYVKNDGATILDAGDNSCVGSETGSRGYYECLHGGEMRVIELPVIPDCTGITASDSLNAFSWECNDSAATVRVITTKLNSEKYLSDLIDTSTTTWKSNFVVIKQGANSSIGKTSAASWWSNPIVKQSTAGTTLNTEGTIYIADADPAANLTISADKVALVIIPGVTHTIPACGIGISGNNNFIWVEGSIDATCATASNGISLAGGNFDVLMNINVSNSSGTGAGQGSGLVFHGDYSLFKDITVSNSYGNGIVLNHANYCTVKNVKISGSRENGLYFYYSDNNFYENVRSTNSTGVGLYGYYSWNSDFYNIITTNNGGDGIYFYVVGNSRALNIISANNAARGIYEFPCGGAYSIQSNITLINNGTDGIYNYHQYDRNYRNVLIANHGGYGLRNNEIYDRGTIDNIIIAHNLNNDAMSLRTSTYLTGLVKLGDVAGNFSSSIQGLSSDFSLTEDITLASTFVGKLTVDDSSNSSDGADGADPGTALFEDCDDRVTFENFFRFWGKGHSEAFPGINHRGACDGAGELCQIWDASLKSGDTGDGGGAVALNVLTLPDGNDTLTQRWDRSSELACSEIAGSTWGPGVCTFPGYHTQAECQAAGYCNSPYWYNGQDLDIDQATCEGTWYCNGGGYGDQVTCEANGRCACPYQEYTDQVSCEAATGTWIFYQWLTYIWYNHSWTSNLCYTKHLRNAVEIMGDGIGNENTLCESGETCLYTPNIGAYQGHGNLISAGEFNDGELTGITLLRYKNNGR